MEMNLFICIFKALVWAYVEVVLSSQKRGLGSRYFKQGKEWRNEAFVQQGSQLTWHIWRKLSWGLQSEDTMEGFS